MRAFQKHTPSRICVHIRTADRSQFRAIERSLGTVKSRAVVPGQKSTAPLGPGEEEFRVLGLLPDVARGAAEVLRAGRKTSRGTDGLFPSPIQQLAVPGILRARRALWRSVSGALRSLSLREEQHAGLSTRESAQVEGHIVNLAQQHLQEVQRRGAHHCVVAAQTGSGKTLAYLLPVVQALRTDENAGVQTRPGRPRALVLVPTRELAVQVLQVLKQMSHITKFRAVALTGGTSRNGKNRLSTAPPIDVVVGTPGRVRKNVQEGIMRLTDVKHVILDEADTLLADPKQHLRESDSFVHVVEELLLPILGRVPHARLVESDLFGVPAQAVVVSATLTQDLLLRVREIFGKHVQIITAKNLHAISQRCQQQFIRATSRDRMALLAETMEDGDASGVSAAVIFCSTADSVRAVEHYLRERGKHAACLHAQMPSRRREDEFGRFLKGDVPALVCTDVAARGLDFSGRVIEHVINFDFPETAEDYLHRAGRTARAGRSGRVTSFLPKNAPKPQRQLARAIEQRATTGSALVFGSDSDTTSTDQAPGSKRSGSMRSRRALSNPGFRLKKWRLG